MGLFPEDVLGLYAPVDPELRSGLSEASGGRFVWPDAFPGAVWDPQKARADRNRSFSSRRMFFRHAAGGEILFCQAPLQPRVLLFVAEFASIGLFPSTPAL